MTEVLKGVDVSAWQGGAIDWTAVKASGASFAGAKCSEGSGYVDPTWAANWAGMAGAGLARISYHFARPDLGNTAAAEAGWFLHCVGPLQVGDIVALDIEVNAPTVNIAAWSFEWLRHVEEIIGFPPLIYANLHDVETRLQDSRLAHYPLWLAFYDQPSPRAVPPWTEVALHQHTDAATYNGIAGPVDESVVARSLDQLRALGKPPAAPATTEPAPVPVTHRVRVVTPQWLRELPRADSARLVECRVDEVFPVIGQPTPHWACVQAHGHRGWLLMSNCERAD